jgi:cobalt-zinc-cadmium efflux system membrane fusion protein
MSASRTRLFPALAGLSIALAACSGKPAAGTASADPAGSDSTKPAAGGAAAEPIALDSAQRAQIRTETARAVPFTASVITTGTVAFNRYHSTAVHSPVSGPVSRILVKPGARVSRGQALATVASPDFADALANYRKSETALRNAQRIATLDEQLFANDALARRDLDQARTDLAAAGADREAAASQLRSLGVDERSIAAIREGRAAPGAEAAIRSPITGTVVERTITPGQLLEAGATQSFIVADLSSVWVLANVFEGDVAGVRKGETVLVTTSASPDTLRGRVDYVAALVDPATKATAVRVLVPNRDGLLRRDMLVNVEIRSDRQRTGILVPVSSVLRNDENLPYVFVGHGRSFVRRSIDLGQRVGDRYEVRSGIQPGEDVVTEGAVFLAGAGA